MSVALTNIKFGSGTATPVFSQCDSITYVDSSGASHDIASAWYASGTTGATEFWAKGASATWKAKNPWADEYGSQGSEGAIVFILYQPTVTHSWTSMRGITDSSYVYNATSAIVQLTDNGDNTFNMSKFIYASSSVDVISVGSSVSGSPEYYFSNTYASGSTIDWDGTFVSGQSYAITLEGAYMSYNILTGSKPALVGASGRYYDWQLSNKTLVTLKKSATGIYAEIIV